MARKHLNPPAGTAEQRAQRYNPYDTPADDLLRKPASQQKPPHERDDASNINLAEPITEDQRRGERKPA
ncbi:MAG TPA: hypothetical protein VFS62_02405 [Chloroflexota bacterium]|jgi:hypothetical protein|nr:hypothetical protein [Chloroflexota bacterium]